jgi:RHS repeat-associated protein
VLEEVVDPQGLALRTSRTHDGSSRLLSITGPEGQSVAVGYDGRGNLIRWDEASVGTTMQMEYDDRGQITRMADATGAATRITRDDFGNVIRLERADASDTVLSRIDYTYDANGNALTETVFRTVDGVFQGFTTTTTYDALNRAVQVEDPFGNVSQTEYDATGLVSAETDALGRRTEYSYDELGSLLRTRFPDGTEELRDYDANGNLTTITDRRGKVTRFEYDELNRLIRNFLPDGAVNEQEYSPGGKIVATIDARGQRTEFLYDTAGRRTQTTFPEVFDAVARINVRPVERLELDAAGRRTARVDANGRRTEYLYNDAGRLVRTLYPDGTSQESVYDSLGRVIESTDEAEHRTLREYDALGRLAAVVDALDGRTTLRYDEVGNLISVTDARNRVTRFSYDALNRLVERRLPGGQRESMVYDAVGNLLSSSDLNGDVVTFEYDVMNRPIQRSYPDGSVVSTKYSPTGQRLKVTDSRGTTSYEYDDNDQIIQVTHPGGEQVAYEYDLNGQLERIESPAGAVSYEHDAVGRLASVLGSAGETSYGYDPAGNVVEEIAPNGVSTRAAYDLRNRVTELRHSRGATMLASFSYQLSPTGRRLRMTEADGSVETYSYDALERLIGETRTGLNPRSSVYEYDAVGNRARRVRNGVQTLYTYDADDRLLTAGATSYTYDPKGNLLSRTTGGASSSYEWNTDGRLVRATSSGIVNDFTYDADGCLVERQSGASVTRYLVDSLNPTGYSQVLEERDGQGSLRAHFIYGGRLLASARGGATSFHHCDALGSTRALTNAAGQIVSTNSFEAFGEIASTTGASENPYKFAGERLDASLGFYDLRARWMDPATGRFVSRDAFRGFASEPRSLHGYLYADADPVNARDPSGYFTLLETQEVSSILGNLARQSVSVLRFYKRAESVKDIVEIVWSLGGALIAVLENGGAMVFPGNTGGARFNSLNAAVRRIAERLSQFDLDDAPSTLLSNLPRILQSSLIAWGLTLMTTPATDVRAFLMYLPNPITIGKPVTLPTPVRVTIAGRRVPVRMIFGGSDIGRLVGGGIQIKSKRSQVWAMDYTVLVGSVRFTNYGRVYDAWPDFPYFFRVLKP